MPNSLHSKIKLLYAATLLKKLQELKKSNTKRHLEENGHFEDLKKTPNIFEPSPKSVFASGKATDLVTPREDRGFEEPRQVVNLPNGMRYEHEADTNSSGDAIHNHFLFHPDHSEPVAAVTTKPAHLENIQHPSEVAAEGDHQVKESKVGEQHKGQGFGKILYSAVLRHFVPEGKKLWSDKSTSPAAQALWQNFRTKTGVTGYIGPHGYDYADNPNFVSVPSHSKWKDSEHFPNPSLPFSTKLAASEPLLKTPLVSDEFEEVNWPYHPLEEGKYAKTITHKDTGTKVHVAQLFDDGDDSDSSSGSIYYITHNGDPKGNPIAKVQVNNNADRDTGDHDPHFTYALTQPEHRGKGLNTMLHVAALRDYGSLKSDSRLSPGSQKTYEKLAQHPNVKAKMAPVNQFYDERHRINTDPLDTQHELQYKPTKLAASEPLMKPYHSDAQRRWAHTPTGTKALGGESAVKHWDKATKGKSLPEKVEKAKGTPVVMTAEEAVDEHKHLVDVLRSPSHKDDIQEAKKQGKELEEYKEKLDEPDLEKGLNGDWKKEGYELWASPAPIFDESGEIVDDDPSKFSVYAQHPKYGDVGRGNYKIENGQLLPDEGDGDNAIEIHPNHQRKGLASAMHKEAESFSGLILNPSSWQTDKGKAVWSNPNRQFGKNEDLEKGLRGDWQKEGYTIKHSPKEWGHRVQAFSPEGKHVGTADLIDKDGGLHPNRVEVHPGHQRRGLASGMLSLASKNTGKKILHTDKVSPDGRKLQDQFGKSEDLEKGQNGDWQKEGYTIKHVPASQYYPEEPTKDGFQIAAHDINGNHAGSVRFEHHSDGNTIYPHTSTIHPMHRRIGLASGMYSLAEKISGKKIVPEGLDSQTADAKALWANPNRQFGKSEDPAIVLNKTDINENDLYLSQLGQLGQIEEYFWEDLEKASRVIGDSDPKDPTRVWGRMSNGVEAWKHNQSKSLYHENYIKNNWPTFLQSHPAEAHPALTKIYNAWLNDPNKHFIPSQNNINHPVHNMRSRFLNKLISRHNDVKLETSGPNVVFKLKRHKPDGPNNYKLFTSVWKASPKGVTYAHKEGAEDFEENLPMANIPPKVNKEPAVQLASGAVVRRRPAGTGDGVNKSENDTEGADLSALRGGGISGRRIRPDDAGLQSLFADEGDNLQSRGVQQDSAKTATSEETQRQGLAKKDNEANFSPSKILGNNGRYSFRLAKAVDKKTWGRMISSHKAGFSLPVTNHESQIREFPHPTNYVNKVLDSKDPSEEVKGHSGIATKMIHSYTNKNNEKQTFMAKPYHNLNDDLFVSHPISGWSTLATKKLFDAGNIGHLTENVTGHTHNDVPITVHHFEPDMSDFGSHMKFNSDTHNMASHVHVPDVLKIATMDFLTNNNDRHAGNFLLSHGQKEHGKHAIKAIDHEKNWNYFDTPNSLMGEDGSKNDAKPYDYFKLKLGDVVNPDKDVTPEHVDTVKQWWNDNKTKMLGALHGQLKHITDKNVRDHIRDNYEHRHKWLDQALNNNPKGDNIFHSGYNSPIGNAETLPFVKWKD